MDKSRRRLENEIKFSDAQIAYLKEHDSLTGMVNLPVIRKNIEHLIQDHDHDALAVLLLGVDCFRLINGTLGSIAGDLILQKISQRIHLHCQKNDLLARKGGDEFLIVIPNISSKEAARRAKLILQTVNKPFFIDGEEINITASIGISLYPKDATCAEDLLIYADFALHHVKEMGKNNYVFFTKKIGQARKYIQLIQNDLNNAIKNRQLFLNYQPKIDTHSQRIVGAEALLRWKHPHLGLIAPDHFIPIAEKMGLIASLGNWVLQQGCLQAKRWQCMHPKPLIMAVNVSAKQFYDFRIKEPLLISHIQSALEESSLPAELLELEITESALMRDDEASKCILKKIKELGVVLACDDFGVGYASFGQLKKLPIDVLKIDKSLIKDITTDSIDVTIIRAIITIARRLHIKIVAEGVENEAQFLLLKDLGCDMVQGNYFCKAIDAQSLEEKFIQAQLKL